MKKLIQIFKPGKHTANNGTTLEFTEADLQASVAAYNPSIFEAALVIGHPKLNDPRYGGVKSLEFNDGHVSAQPADVLPEFAEMVNKKLFNAVSASWYSPDAANNPVPGVYYLRHVGFLGAAPPAIKGLNSNGISFAEDEPGVIHFSEFEFSGWDQLTISKLFRRIREYFISTIGIEGADNIIQDYEISSLEINATQDLLDAPKQIHYNEGDEMSAEEKAKLTTLEAENAQLKKQQADFAEAQSKTRRDAAHKDHVDFAEGLVKSGRLLPVQKDSVIASLDYMAAPDAVVEFGEGDDKKPLLQAFKDALAVNPIAVNFGEHKEKSIDTKASGFKAPAGFSVDQTNLELHEKALAYSEQNSVSYETALSKVQ